MPLVVCKQCGAKVSDEYSFCMYCSAPIGGKSVKSETGTKKESCPNCGSKINRGNKFCAKCGQAVAINVEEVLNSTLRMIWQAPLLLLPMFVELLFSTLLGLWIGLQFLQEIEARSTPSLLLAALWSALPRFLVLVAFGILALPLVRGMYPSMVRDLYKEKKLQPLDALRKAVKKYPSLLASYIAVSGLVMAGSLLLLVPGLILSTWYYYTIPAIVLEDRGTLDGMSASKKFARNKKWATLLLISIPVGITLLGSLVRRSVSILTPSGLAITVGTELVFGLITGVLEPVMSSHTYLSYAMRRRND